MGFGSKNVGSSSYIIFIRKPPEVVSDSNIVEIQGKNQIIILEFYEVLNFIANMLPDNNEFPENIYQEKMVIFPICDLSCRSMLVRRIVAPK